MKRYIAIMSLLLLSGVVARAGKYVEVAHKIDGRVRTGVLFLPTGLREGAPIVTCVHGYTGSANPKSFDLDPVAEREGFAVLYPQGLKDPAGNAGFYVGYPTQKGMNVDDVKALCELTRYVEKEYRLSRRNAFLTGMSNGGDICYLAALQGQRVFKAFAPVAGLAFTWFFEKYAGTNPRPVPMFEIHGTADHVSEWGGDPTGKGGWGPYLSVPMAVGYWTARNLCTREDCDTVASKDPRSPHRVIRHRYSGGLNEVWLYEVVGAPHCWHSGDIDTGEEIWKFFSKYVE